MSKRIEENILSSTGFHGRLSAEITLDELPLQVCNEFWGEQKETVSAYDKFKILSVCHRRKIFRAYYKFF